MLKMPAAAELTRRLWSLRYLLTAATVA